MKRLILLLFTVILPLAGGCASDSIVGPPDDERVVTPAEEECNQNTQLC